MKEEKKETEKRNIRKNWRREHGASNGGFYFLAIIGVAVYYVQQVSGFWPTVLAILKAIVWPAMLMHEVFTRLAM